MTSYDFRWISKGTKNIPEAKPMAARSSNQIERRFRGGVERRRWARAVAGLALALALAACQTTSQPASSAGSVETVRSDTDAGLVYGNHPVIEAIIGDDVATVRTLLDEGLDPGREYELEHPRWNDGEPTKMSLPLAAAMFGRLEIAKMVYDHPRYRGSKIRNTEVLCMSISHRHPEVALYVLEKDVYANPPGGCSGWFTPMSRAKDLEMDEVVAALRKAGG